MVYFDLSFGHPRLFTNTFDSQSELYRLLCPSFCLSVRHNNQLPLAPRSICFPVVIEKKTHIHNMHWLCYDTVVRTEIDIADGRTK